ncbi:MAG: hypothetical protein PVJ09_04305 [Candidatus Woesebacteria bacterium]|jgi:nanoRNase/pAp phosphatase (c-di-AMP/oligoRNAs hydrolase)
MITAEEISNLKDLLSKAQTVLVMLGEKASFDQVASASSLYLALKQNGKKTGFFSPSNDFNGHPNKEEFLQIQGIKELKQELGHQNLLISFDYQETQVDKVSYHIGEQTGKFYLTIKPQSGHEPLNPEAVDFSFTGADADLIFLVGIHEFESLGNLYYGFETLYEDAGTVTIHNFKPDIANIKLDTSGSVCMSEAMLLLLENLEFEIDDGIATNLLAAIEQSTQSFSSLSATAETFEIVARLLRAGARRIKKTAASITTAPKKIEKAKVIKEKVLQQGVESGQIMPKKSPSPKKQQVSEREETAPEGNFDKEGKRRAAESTEKKVKRQSRQEGSLRSATKYRLKQRKSKRPAPPSASFRHKKQQLNRGENSKPGGLKYHPGGFRK